MKMLMEIVMVDDDYEDLLEYLNRTGYVTELYVMTGENRIHATAVASDVSELKYLARMVTKKFDDRIKSIGCHGVKEIVKESIFYNVGRNADVFYSFVVLDNLKGEFLWDIRMSCFPRTVCFW